MIKIRLANRKDIPIILGLFNNNMNLTGGSYRYAQEDLLEYIDNKLCRLFVYEENNTIVGVVSLEIWRIAKVGYIGEIIIDKKHRGRGIGTKLIAHVEKFLRKLKIPTIFLLVDENNREMINFTQRLKYKKGRKYIEHLKEIKITKKYDYKRILIILILAILQTFINLIFFFVL